ncbi:lipid droplet-associated hydrolase isoform X2 [Scleropages formosus]|uniref:lipid droplet-associated hydrolase isoform X2 n=1 Tax=Scleropages formosus TaxID=113540 RepID=UPI0010FA6C64|nr:lipid droplet-associated hydrolase isoform X2 [Scleropages formosus]
MLCSSPMISVFPTVCSASSHLFPSNSFTNSACDLVLFWNPGMVGFYRTFMETLYQAFEGRYPVWAVSHAGHCVPPDTMDMLEDVAPVQTGDVFGLQGQIEHKLAFLREHVPRDTRLVLIGHSIGCYIILDMMKREPRLQVLKSVLLFPTIERMAATPQGRLMTPVLCRLRYATYLPVFLLSLLPLGLKTSIVKFALRGLSSLDPKITNAAVRLLSVDCVANAMYMGSQEMVQVLERDSCTIGQNLDKLVFYYGATDHWCPVQYYQDIKRDFPDGNIQLCSRGFRHAFVLDSGREVAAMAAKWLRDDLQGL